MCVCGGGCGSVCGQSVKIEALIELLYRSIRVVLHDMMALDTYRLHATYT